MDDNSAVTKEDGDEGILKDEDLGVQVRGSKVTSLKLMFITCNQIFILLRPRRSVRFYRTYFLPGLRPGRVRGEGHERCRPRDGAAAKRGRAREVQEGARRLRQEDRRGALT